MAAAWTVRDRLPTPLLSGAFVVAVALATFDAATFDAPDDHVGTAVRRLVRELPDLGDEPVLASSTVSADLVFGGFPVGLEVLVLELERGGVETVVDDRLADKYGPRRADDERAEDREVILVEADGGAEPRGFRTVGVVDPLPPALREERTRLLEALDLEVDATPADIIGAAADDPSRRDLAAAVLAIEDIPRFELMVSPALG